MATLWAACGLAAAFAQEEAKNLRKPLEQIVDVRALAFSPDGQLLAASAGELKGKGEVVLWDLKTQKPRWSYGIDRGMPSVAFSPDGKTLAVGSFSENCYLFNAATGALKDTLAGHGESARSLAFAASGDILAVGSYDQTIRLWDWRAGKVTQTLTGQDDKVYSLAYLPDKKTLASGGAIGSACLWDTSSGTLLHRWERGASPVAIDPKGQWLATAGNDASVSLRSLQDYDKVLAHYDGIMAYRMLVIHPSGKSFASNSGMYSVVYVHPIDLAQATPTDEKRVRELLALWDHDSYEVREKASQDLAKIGNRAKPLLNQALAESKSAEVRIRARVLLRQLGVPKPLAQLDDHRETVTSVSFAPDGRTLATATRDGQVRLWDTETYKIQAKIDWPLAANRQLP
jgi:WD40 repeat protein